MILAGIVFVAAVAVALLIATPFGDREPDAQPARSVPEPAPEPEPEPAPVATEPAPEPEPEPAPEPGGRGADQETIPATAVTVRAGDTLYDIAGEFWGDPFLWPLLLQANDEPIRDPDYLRPGQRVQVPAWVTLDSGLTEEQRGRLAEAHALAYEHYRSLGAAAVGLGMGQPEWWRERLGRERLNKAHWVLYSGLRYDEDLLDRHASRIRADDATEVRSFVARYGLPPTRR